MTVSERQISLLDFGASNIYWESGDNSFLKEDLEEIRHCAWVDQEVISSNEWLR